MGLNWVFVTPPSNTRGFLASWGDPTLADALEYSPPWPNSFEATISSVRTFVIPAVKFSTADNVVLQNMRVSRSGQFDQFKRKNLQHLDSVSNGMSFGQEMRNASSSSSSPSTYVCKWLFGGRRAIKYLYIRVPKCCAKGLPRWAGQASIDTRTPIKHVQVISSH